MQEMLSDRDVTYFFFPFLTLQAVEKMIIEIEYSRLKSMRKDFIRKLEAAASRS